VAQVTDTTDPTDATSAVDDVQAVDVPVELWGRYGTLTVDDLPAAVHTVAVQCVLDWLGCTLAGSREQVTRLVADEVSDVEGPATLLGQGRRTGVLQAALVNGTAGHALDYDDASTIMGGHPSVPVLPGALALAEERGLSGADVLAAFVAGVEVENRLGIAVGPTHYARGWHATATMGVFGATTAAAMLLGLDDEQAANALGLAASQAGGVKANFGTMTKPFHAGFAAERGLLTARLAKRGFTADPGSFSDKQGLVAAAGDGSIHRERLDRYDDQWLLLRTLFKYHAACYLTHAAIDATLSLPIDEPVERVTVTVNPSILDACGIPRPTTGLEGKFSLAATTAFALKRADTTDPDTFTDARVQDPELQSLIRLVDVDVDPSYRMTAAKVRVRTAGGVHEASADTGVPASDLDAQGDLLRRKFLGLAGPVVGRGAAGEVVEIVERIAEVGDLRDLTTLVAGDR
jgi:2-methylcitrate dehydratase PrpD